MKFLLPYLLVAFLFPCICPGQNESKEISKETVLKAMEVFCADPLSQDARQAGALVLKFVEKSPAVEVEIGPKSVPWINEEPQTQHASLLLVAYTVGNAKAQLESGKAKNDSFAGVLQAIATYRTIQKQEPDLKMADLEKMIELNSQNKLKAYLETP